MSTSIFRDREILIGPNKKIILKKKTIPEIFTFGAPYVIIGQTGCGKTKLSMHLIHHYASQCTKIFYVSKTKSSSFGSSSDNDIAAIPRVFRREPTYEAINGIWTDMIAEKEANDVSPEDFEHMLINIWDSDRGRIKKDLKIVKEKCESVYKSSYDMYLKKKIEEPQAAELADRDKKALSCTLLSMMVIDGIKQNGSKGLNEREMTIAYSLVSKKPKTLLILDDVTTEMELMKTTRSKMVQYQGITSTIDKAYNALINDILTRARHFNCIVAIFLHNLDVLKKELVKNFVLFDNSSVAKVRASHLFVSEVKTALSNIAQEVFTEENKHYFIYANLEGSCSYCVGKADLFTGPISLSPVNAELVRAYDAVVRSGTDDDPDSDDDSGSDLAESSSEDSDNKEHDDGKNSSIIDDTDQFI